MSTVKTSAETEAIAATAANINIFMELHGIALSVFHLKVVFSLTSFHLNQYEYVSER